MKRIKGKVVLAGLLFIGLVIAVNASGMELLGAIVEQDLAKSVQIKSRYGSEGDYCIEDIEKIAKDEKEIETEPVDLRSTAYLELGVNFGTPAAINAALGYWFGVVGLRISGFYWGDLGDIHLSGIQGNLGFKLSDNIHRSHVLALVGGTMRMEFVEKILWYEYVYTFNWTYLGIAYNLNVGGFFLEVGGSVGWGDFPSPQLILQIGYMHRFIPKQES